jgi:RHS repeat-associated protein
MGGLDEIFGEITAGGTTSYFTDALGSTVALSDGSGTTTAEFTYEPYGKNTKTGSGDTPFRYTARDDDGTGLYYYRARYYHPGLGRFISEDPIGLAGGVNLYAYVHGNPVSLVDPLGLDTLVFNEGNVRHYDDNWNMVSEIPATTGRDGVTDPSVPWQGPIPPGLYYMDPTQITEGGFFRNLTGDWGKYRAPLTPAPVTETFGRSGFFIHGGKKPGSAGCIDVGENDKTLFPGLKDHPGLVEVLVY